MGDAAGFAFEGTLSHGGRWKTLSPQNIRGYTLGDIVPPPIYNGNHLQADLNLLAAHPTSEADVHLMNAFLDEVAGSIEARWKLLKWAGESHVSPYFNCKAINCFQSDGYNVYRIRPLKSVLNKYRVIYSYDTEFDEFRLLGILIAYKGINTPPPNGAHYDYSKAHQFSVRIRTEYDTIGIPKL